MSYCKTCRNNRVIYITMQPQEGIKVYKPQRKAIHCPECFTKEQQSKQEIAAWNVQAEAKKQSA